MKVLYNIGFFLTPDVITHYIPEEEIKYDVVSHKGSNRNITSKRKRHYNKNFKAL